MTIDELKRALVEVKKICREHESCSNCEFSLCLNSKFGVYSCKLAPSFDDACIPDEWEIDDWKEE